MFIQIEITTICNFNCWYCAGRHMPQRHMSYEKVREIIEQRVSPKDVVNLQGEGEPMLHPDFWKMAELVKQKDARMTTITNGGYRMTDTMKNRVRKYLDEVYISLDTMDAEKADAIGRYHLPQVLDTIKEYSRLVPVTIMYTHLGDESDKESVRAFAMRNGLRFNMQDLQVKDDYSQWYPISVEKKSVVGDKFMCGILMGDDRRFFNLDGVELPCCFIKDVSEYRGMDDMKEEMGVGVVPSVCRGCKFLRKIHP